MPNPDKSQKQSQPQPQQRQPDQGKPSVPSGGESEKLKAPSHGQYGGEQRQQYGGGQSGQSGQSDKKSDKSGGMQSPPKR